MVQVLNAHADTLNWIDRSTGEERNRWGCGEGWSYKSPEVTYVIWEFISRRMVIDQIDGRVVL